LPKFFIASSRNVKSKAFEPKIILSSPNSKYSSISNRVHIPPPTSILRDVLIAISRITSLFILSLFFAPSKSTT